MDLLDLAMLAIEGLTGLGNGKLPMDFSALSVALAAVALDLVGELGLGGNTPLQALAGEGGEVGFNLVEPGAAPEV